MRLVYVAGPYRAKTAWGREQNIQAARYMGSLVAALGAYPAIPHANTSHMDGLCDDKFFLDGTLEMMRRCDAVVLVGKWRDSVGTLAEISEAQRMHIPVFETITQLGTWVMAQQTVAATQRVAG